MDRSSSAPTLLPDQIEIFKSHQSSIQENPNNGARTIWIKEGGKAYVAVQQLVERGHFNRNKENTEKWIDFDSQLHCRTLAVALRFFNSEDTLENLNIVDRSLCMDLDNVYRQYEYGYLPPIATSTAKNVIDFVSNYSWGREFLNVIGEVVPGVNTSGEKIPMKLNEFTRIWPEKILDKDVLEDLFTDFQTSFSEEVKEYLKNKQQVEQLAELVEQLAELQARIRNLFAKANNDALDSLPPIVIEVASKNNAYKLAIDESKGSETEILDYLNFLNNLCSKVLQFIAPSSNNLQDLSENGNIIFDPMQISRHPEFFVGFFASKTPKEFAEGAILNRLLFKEIGGMYAEFCDYLRKNPNLRTVNVNKSLHALEEVLQKQCVSMKRLQCLPLDFHYRAIQDKKKLEKLITEAISSHKEQRVFHQMEFVRDQMKAPCNNIQQLQSQYVGKKKYYLSELINRTPLHAPRENLKLHDLYSKTTSYLHIAVFHPDRTTFHNRCEAKIQDKMEAPLKDFIPCGFLPGYNNIKLHLSLSKKVNYATRYVYALSNMRERIDVHHSTFTVDDHKKSSQWSVNGSSDYKNNEKDLLKFQVKYSLNSLTYKTTFFGSSVIQEEDIIQIKVIQSVADVVLLNEHTLHNEYVDWLNNSINAEKLSCCPNTFRQIASQGELIPSLNGNLLPVLLPHRLLEEIDQILFTDILNLSITGVGSLIPFVDFKSVASGRYILSLNYRITSEIEDYCSFTLATFDKAAVESFKKIKFKKGQTPNKYTYEIGVPHLQEFLLQAMYADNKCPLPGKGTFRLKNEDLYIPNPQRFKGLFSIWQDQPRTITYDSKLYEENNDSSLYGPLLQPKSGKGYLSAWQKVRSQKNLKDDLKDTFSSYEESFHIFKGALGLSSGLFGPVNVYVLDKDTSKSKLERLGLFDPKNPELFYFNVYMNGKALTPSVSNTFKLNAPQTGSSSSSGKGSSATDSTPSSTLQTGPTITGLPNVDSSCWLNTILQWLRCFPRLQVGAKKVLNNAGKDHIAKLIELTLSNYGKNEIVDNLHGLISLFKNELHGNRESPSPTEYDDPGDFIQNLLPFVTRRKSDGRLMDGSTLSYIACDNTEFEKAVQERYHEFVIDSNVTLHEYVVLEPAKARGVLTQLPDNEIIELGDSCFSIVGVIEHKILSNRVQHYVAYTKENGTWTEFDDTKVKKDLKLRDFAPRGKLFLLEKIDTL